MIKNKGPQTEIYCNKTKTLIDELPCPAGSIVESILEQEVEFASRPRSSGPLLGDCEPPLERMQNARKSQIKRAKEAYTPECYGCILNPDYTKE